MHIETKFLVYYILILLCCIAGLVKFRQKKNLWPIFVLLPFSLTTELTVEYFIYKKWNFYPIYHFYEILDFTFFSLFFYNNAYGKKFKLFIRVAFIFFLLIIVCITIFNGGVKEYPSLQYSFESIFLATISIVFLFNFTPESASPIWKYEMFWICIGLIIFHSGILVVNGAYNYLKSLSTHQALAIKNWINMGFNYFLYACLLMVILWPKSTMK